MAKYKKPPVIDILQAAAKKAHWKYPYEGEVLHLKNLLKRYKGFSQIKSWDIEIYQGSDWDVGGNVSKVIVVDSFGQKWELP